MTSRLRDAFDDLTTDVAPFVVGDDLGRTAWRAGRRRRARRLLTTSGLAVAAVALLAVAAPPWATGRHALPPATGDGTGLTGYPSRVVAQAQIGVLPERPGPVAGVVDIVDEDGARSGWHALSERGRLWRLDRANGASDWPALSRDGRRLAYLAGHEGPYVIRDLVTGATTRMDSLGGETNGQSSPYWVSSQSPNFWSPDGSLLLLPGGDREPGTPGVLLVSPGGWSRFVPGAGLGFPAGWLGQDRLVWVSGSSDDPTAVGYTLTATTTDTDGTPLASVTLRPARNWLPDSGLGQWSPAVSPDGSELLIVDHHRNGTGAVVHRFSLRDGGESAASTVDDAQTPCAASWVGGVPAVPENLPNTGAGNAATVLLEPAGPRRVVTADPLLDTRCLIWASDALAGQPYEPSVPSWTAWWPGLLAGVLGLAVLVAFLLYPRRRPAPPSPGRDRPDEADQA
ncbi:hypothetical protein AB0B66_07185 [Catellatospora sp. NPDC049111]|uniref:hypothetical protein n=1 Tax=Catellatospora sp. NPDC049111 TaxID=3155271 RepID=UPI0033D0FCEE